MPDTNPPPIRFKLYVITDRSLCSPRPLEAVIAGLLDVGVSAIQLREKDLSDTEFMKLAEPIAKLCRSYAAQLFINSRLAVAQELGATGLHLPADTSSVGAIREQTPRGFLIGCSVHTFGEAKVRDQQRADFVTYSPIYLTASKPGYGPAVGLDNLRKVSDTLDTPVFALGGVTPDRVSDCLNAGACGVAVMSGVMSPEHGVVQAKAYLRTIYSL